MIQLAELNLAGSVSLACCLQCSGLQERRHTVGVDEVEIDNYVNNLKSVRYA